MGKCIFDDYSKLSLLFDFKSCENIAFHNPKGFMAPENYRIFTFHKSDSTFIQVDDAAYATTHKRWFYDEKWRFCPFSYNFPVLSDEITHPASLAAMLEISQRLCDSAFTFVRVDLYTLADRIYCGELTFTPCGGVGAWSGDWDRRLGQLWR